MDSNMTSNLLSSKFRPIIETQTHQAPECPSPIQYKSANNHHSAQELAIRFLFECGTKLKTNPVTSAVAAQIYHRFLDAVNDSSYDPYMIGATALYIASKQQDEPVKIRDLINVVHRTLNRDTDVLDLSEEYWNYRDSIVQAELLTMRMINFKTINPDIHLYMLNYLKSLSSWIPPAVWEKSTLVKLCWTFLQDFHHCKVIIQYEPQLVALAVIYFGLQVCGIVIPCTTEQDQLSWHEAFHKAAKKEDIWNIIEHLLALYEHDKDMK
ncbi:cyclin-Q [Daphnia magna]|uniref:Cyclin-Q n=2 Tax=Daphnia magna TaxID=35525 RepID=A0A0P5VQF5_9CRUS|nr:cyclin-Q [Daphnia magna]KAK4020879.1 hypothetical protein OUZ56_002821 [Daphnia magna]KZS05731.1 Cyclin-like protein [Daphnia magna]